MSHNKLIIVGIFAAAVLSGTSCDQSSLQSSTSGDAVSKLVSASSSTPPANVNTQRDTLVLGSVEGLADINQKLSEKGLSVRLAYVETITKETGAETASGQTIYADDRQKQLDSQWVPGDERRVADGNNLTYLVYEPYSLANFGTSDQVDGEPAVDASFNTWNKIKKNAKLDIVKRPDSGEFPSAIFAGGNPYLADITELGFLPGFYFDLILGPGASSSVLGVTFTFVFIDEEENPTDINNDGFTDTALKEVWYNDAFLWKTDSDSNVSGTDIETVALHENGHALGFGHFGKIFVTNGNGKLHVAPRAVMNAVVLGTQRDLLGTDKASYNNIYGNWPKN